MLPLQLRHLQIMLATKMIFVLLNMSKNSIFSGQEEVVLIGDTPVKRYKIECLFQPDAQLYDEVITS